MGREERSCVTANFVLDNNQVAVPKNLLGVFLRSPVGAVVFGINNFQLFIGICNVRYKVFTVPKILLQGTPASRHVEHKLVSESRSGSHLRRWR